MLYQLKQATENIDEAKAYQLECVVTALANGASWEEIAETTGHKTRQAARQFFTRAGIKSVTKKEWVISSS